MRSGEQKNRPAIELAEKVDKFVTTIAEQNLDKKTTDFDQLLVIKDQLKFVVNKFERRPEFIIEDQMSSRKRELDVLIENAEADYAERKRAHDTQAALIDSKLLEMSRQLQAVQNQALVKELKNMNEYLFYHTKIVQQIRDINNSLDDEGCCARSCFCFFGHSKEIQQKQKQLKMLQAEQDAFGSEDHTIVSQILKEKIEKDRAELLKQQELLAANQPKETAQLLRDERAKLQADIDAKREAYYHTIHPTVMLNLVRFQSFLKRMQKKLNAAKSAEQATNNFIKINLIDGVQKIVSTFLKKFNELCTYFVCRPPANVDNKISYAQYCERFHNLQEKEKLLLIKGPPNKKEQSYEETRQKIQQLNDNIFYEHLEPLMRPDIALAVAPERESFSPVMRM